MFFQYPKLLWLLVIPVLLLALYVYRELCGRQPHLRVSTLTPWKKSGFSVMAVLRHLPYALKLAALSLIIVAIARPRSSEELERIDTEGIDIVMAMDVSSSMLARDFKPDRLSAAKDIAIEFLASRPADRMGIVVWNASETDEAEYELDVKGWKLHGTVDILGTNGYNVVQVKATSAQPVADVLKIGEKVEAKIIDIEEDRKSLMGDFCRGCGYCMPCPQGIEINNCARMSLMLRRAPSAAQLSEKMQAEMKKIEDCIECGSCSSKCPYGLDTPALLRKNYEDYKLVLAGKVSVI